MTVSVYGQAVVFLYSLILGAVLGMFYDVFRIIRIALKSSTASVFIQDLLYFSSSAVICFVFMMKYNFGELRGYILLGALIGFAVYYRTIGKIVYKCASIIIKFITKVIRLTVRIITYPFVQAGRILSVPFGKIYLLLKKIVKKCGFCVIKFKKFVKSYCKKLKSIVLSNNKNKFKVSNKNGSGENVRRRVIIYNGDDDIGEA